nr:hypothetical protein RSP597_15910 [Ralstonia solanacearum]
MFFAMPTIPRPLIEQYIFEMLRYAVLCVKHPGFAEERELINAWHLVAQVGYRRIMKATRLSTSKESR